MKLSLSLKGRTAFVIAGAMAIQALAPLSNAFANHDPYDPYYYDDCYYYSDCSYYGTSDPAADAIALIIIAAVMGGLTTTYVVNELQYASRESSILIDQAYAGNGDKISQIAAKSGKSPEVVSNTIVDLVNENKISPKDPQKMTQEIAIALASR